MTLSCMFVFLFSIPLFVYLQKFILFIYFFSVTHKGLVKAMVWNHLIFCHPLLLLPSIFPSIFTNESALPIRWPKFWSFSFSNNPSNEYSGLISFRIIGLISLWSKGPSRVFSSTTIWKHRFFAAQPSLWSLSHICTWLPDKL